MRRYFNRERLAKNAQCRACGAQSKLVSRKNYPFGRNSKSRTIKVYKCASCNTETNVRKSTEVKR